jgi:hypothetical protein
MRLLGFNLVQQKKWADAEPFLRDSLAVLATKEPKAWTTFYTQATLGNALLAQKKYAGAEPLLKKGCEGMKAQAFFLSRQGKTQLIESLAGIVALYEATGNKDETARWRTELDKAKGR